jgi:hypothetical protein
VIQAGGVRDSFVRANGMTFSLFIILLKIQILERELGFWNGAYSLIRSQWAH